MESTLDINLLDPVNVADPYRGLAPLRNRAPIIWSETHRAWLVLRHAEYLQALREPRLSSDRIRPVFEKLDKEERERRSPTENVLQRWMVFNDPPEHTRLRGLVSGAFTPKVIRTLAPRIETLVDELLEELEGQDVVDIIEQFAFPLPAIVVAEMLGVPDSDRHLFKTWSSDIVSLIFGAASRTTSRQRGQDALIALSDYLRVRIQAAGAADGDNLLGALTRSRVDDDSLSEDEVVATCVLLLFAGHETTTSLLGNSLRSLLMNPDELAYFRSTDNVLKKSIEELIRFDGPSKVQVRRTSEDLDFAGSQLREGDAVFMIQSSVNRDERAFDDPDSLNLRREVNRHVGFGFGIHHCLGAPLARLEASIALPRLLDRFPQLALTDSEPQWNSVIVSRGMAQLELSLGDPVRSNGGSASGK